MPATPYRRAARPLRAAWIVATILFALVWFGTALAGPVIAVWAWTVVAIPLWIATTVRRWRLLLVGLCATLAVSVGIPAMFDYLGRQRRGVPGVLAPVLVTLVVLWPLVLAVVGWRVLGSQATPRAP